MLLSEMAGERFLQHSELARMLCRASCASVLGPLAGDQGRQHVPPGDPDDNGDNCAELDEASSSSLLPPRRSYTDVVP